MSTLGTLWKLVVSNKTTKLKEMIPRNIQSLSNCSGRGFKHTRLGVVGKLLEMLLSFELLGMSTFCLLTKLSRMSWTTGNGHLLWVLRSLQTDSIIVSQVRVSRCEPAESETHSFLTLLSNYLGQRHFLFCTAGISVRRVSDYSKIHHIPAIGTSMSDCRWYQAHNALTRCC